ncbi:uncharacterized protein LOC100906374 [Galendromus occidentalis]|uniref:Uncharacterized protein LOC100906374 n=1 Tax=Galendromus occidentalis TaxID=34638 RepID=A0AAJ7SHT0_9ACAR|nr:uncharacterized protein LOC100906374 [Galendromus occidentalis]
MSYAGSYRFASIGQLDELVMRVSLTRQSTAFNFGHPILPSNASDELSLEFRWQEHIARATNRLFTINQEQLSNNLNLVKKSFSDRRRSFLADCSKRPRSSRDEKSVGPQYVVGSNPERLLLKKCVSMFVLADFTKKIGTETDSENLLDATPLDTGHVLVELHLIEDSYGFQLRVIPDFSDEPYTLRGNSENTYIMSVTVKKPNVLQDLQISFPRPTNEKSVFLSKKMAEMSIAQPKEGQIRTTIFGEIVSAVGFPKNKSLFVLYTASSPHGWSLLGKRAEDELNATFSSISLRYRPPGAAIAKNIAHFGHPFHFNYTTTEPENLPRMHFKVVHFDVNTERYHTLATGSASVGESNLARVPLVRTIPKGFVERLRERFIGGSKCLTGIVVGQKIASDSYTVPEGELIVRVQVLRQSRKYRLEDLLIESQLRLLKSSGQTLSTVQVALSAFQEARLKMIQARQEQKQIVDTEVSNQETRQRSAQRRTR